MTYVPTRLKSEIIIRSIVTIHYFEYMKDFFFQGETHNFWEFLYVDKGAVMVQADEEWIFLKAGDIIFHQPNEFHAIRSIGKTSPNLIAVSFITHSSAVWQFAKKHFTLNQEERILLAKIIDEAAHSFTTSIHDPQIEQVELAMNSPFASQQMILLYLQMFLIMLYRRNLMAGAGVVSVGGKSQVLFGQNRLDNIIQYLQLHVYEPLQIADICKHFYIGRSALQALFHEKRGCGVVHYFHQLKIAKAKEMIRSENMSLAQIADFLSYSSLSHFSKQFKKNTGMSPTQYRFSIIGMTENLKKPRD